MRNPSQIREWTIYKITNPNGRIYIGKTLNYPQRLRQYRCIQLKEQALITRSLLKYGFCKHHFEVIDSFIGTSQDCSSKEMFWIRSYMSNSCKFKEMNGMNMTDGGEGALGTKKSKEYVEKFRLKNLGKKLSEEHKKNISIGLKGKSFHVFGRKQSEEEKERRASKIRGLKRNEKQIENYRKAQAILNGHKIEVTDTLDNKIMIFDSLAEAARNIGVNRNTISAHLNNKIKSAPLIKNRKFIFKYK